MLLKKVEFHFPLKKVIQILFYTAEWKIFFFRLSFPSGEQKKRKIERKMNSLN